MLTRMSDSSSGDPHEHRLGGRSRHPRRTAPHPPATGQRATRRPHERGAAEDTLAPRQASAATCERPPRRARKPVTTRAPAKASRGDARSGARRRSDGATAANERPRQAALLEAEPRLAGGRASSRRGRCRAASPPPPSWPGSSPRPESPRVRELLRRRRCRACPAELKDPSMRAARTLRRFAIVLGCHNSDRPAASGDDLYTRGHAEPPRLRSRRTGDPMRIAVDPRGRIGRIEGRSAVVIDRASPSAHPVGADDMRTSALQQRLCSPCSPQRLRGDRLRERGSPACDHGRRDRRREHGAGQDEAPQDRHRHLVRSGLLRPGDRLRADADARGRRRRQPHAAVRHAREGHLQGSRADRCPCSTAGPMPTTPTGTSRPAPRRRWTITETVRVGTRVVGARQHAVARRTARHARGSRHRRRPGRLIAASTLPRAAVGPSVILRRRPVARRRPARADVDAISACAANAGA